MTHYHWDLFCFISLVGWILIWVLLMHVQIKTTIQAVTLSPKQKRIFVCVCMCVCVRKKRISYFFSYSVRVPDLMKPHAYWSHVLFLLGQNGYKSFSYFCHTISKIILWCSKLCLHIQREGCFCYLLYSKIHSSKYLFNLNEEGKQNPLI